jgi:hypothetical protein
MFRLRIVSLSPTAVLAGAASARSLRRRMIPRSTDGHGMDIVAHALWAGVGVALARRKMPIDRRTAGLTVALAVLPDVLQLLPLLAWILSTNGALETLSAYSLASPGTEPALPPVVALVTHHLHCIAHSAIVAATATAACWLWLRRFWLPLAGWWLHIVIDVFTHSADFYPSPVLYPLTMWGFDGVAWNAPWFLAANYAALVAAGAWLFATRRRAERDGRRISR